LRQARIVWTTNFDRLIEDSLAQMLGTTTAFQIAGLDAPHLASDASLSSDRPYVVKLHGDFLSTRLKNTASELKAQDAELRRVLGEECSRHGLAVVGYSGRDESIMEALEAVIRRNDARSFPHGLFWFCRIGATPSDKVRRLFALATDSNVDAHLVESNTFDELVHDLFTLLDNSPEDVRQILDRHTQRLRQVPIPLEGRSWPVIRLNAFPITSAPTVCRKVVCAIGGTGEVKKAISDAKAPVIAVRRQAGVICFGSDTEVRRVFAEYNITECDLYPIEARRLEFESADLGLVLEALVRALVRERPLKALHTRGGWKVHVDSDRSDDPRLDCLKALRGGFCGTVPGTDLRWSEAILVHIVRRLERLWMLFEPSVWIDWPVEQPDEAAASEGAEPAEDDLQIATVREFVRERAATRFNPELLKVFDGWAALITGSSTPSKAEVTLRALAVTDGIDASFTIQGTTGFSKRAT
jgi:hypothetical protein